MNNILHLFVMLISYKYSDVYHIVILRLFNNISFSFLWSPQEPPN